MLGQAHDAQPADGRGCTHRARFASTCWLLSSTRLNQKPPRLQRLAWWYVVGPRSGGSRYPSVGGSPGCQEIGERFLAPQPSHASLIRAISTRLPTRAVVSCPAVPPPHGGLEASDGGGRVRSLPDAEREAVAAAVTVREVDTDGELEQVASLRAEAYYEDQVRWSSRNHTRSTVVSKSRPG